MISHGVEVWRKRLSGQAIKGAHMVMHGHWEGLTVLIDAATSLKSLQVSIERAKANPRRKTVKVERTNG